MKTVNIGTRNELYIAEKANTNYVLEKGDTVDPGAGNRALYTNDDLKGVSYDIAGTVKGQTGIRIYSDDVKNAVTVDIARTGKIITTQDGIDSHGDGHVFHNDGRIAGLGGDGISTYGSSTVVNTGEISGQYAGIYLSTSTDDIGILPATAARFPARVSGFAAPQAWTRSSTAGQSRATCCSAPATIPSSSSPARWWAT